MLTKKVRLSLKKSSSVFFNDLQLYRTWIVESHTLIRLRKHINSLLPLYNCFKEKKMNKYYITVCLILVLSTLSSAEDQVCNQETGQNCRCSLTPYSRELAFVAIHHWGASNAAKIPDAGYCSCDPETEVKSYCAVGSNSKMHVCCIKKNTPCNKLHSNAEKMCKKGHMFCSAQPKLIDAKNEKVCGFLGLPKDNPAHKACSGNFFDRCVCPEGEEPYLREYFTKTKKTGESVTYLQPDCRKIVATGATVGKEPKPNLRIQKPLLKENEN